MDDIHIHPLRFDQAIRFQPREQGIDRSGRHDETRIPLQKVQDFETIKLSRPETCEYRHVQTPLTELVFPFIGLGCTGSIGLHASYYVIRYMLLSTDFVQRLRAAHLY